MLFNIYYMNFSKVYEIKMMLSNIIASDKVIESSKGDSIDGELHAKLGTKFLKIFDAEVSTSAKANTSASEKVLENFKVAMTKSLILNEVIEKCNVITSFEENVSEGQLIRLDNVKLSLENEKELRTVKMFSNGSFKGMTLPEVGGMDINNLFNSIFKDYSYKLKGIRLNDEKIVLKIPLTFESEFENLYNVDDLFIGNVSIVGIYKGKIKLSKLKNSFEFFQELGMNTQKDFELEVQDSQSIPETTVIENQQDDNEYNYIDLLAIVQVILPKEEISDGSKFKKEKK